MRTTVFTSLLILNLSQFAPADDQSSIDLTQINRSIRREPEYTSEPHYALIVIGLEAEHRSWLVMDGNDTLYFDRNGNGDLTEPEDRIALDVEATNSINLAAGSAFSGMNVFPIGMVHGVKLQFDFWVRAPGVIPDSEFSRRIQQQREQNNWETGTLWRTADDGSRAQNGTVLAGNPDDTQITHLNGPLTFALKWGERQRLEPWPKYSTLDVHVGTPGLPARNSTHGVFSALTETEVPRDLHPLAIVQFPSEDPDGAPIRQVVELDLRCCGDTVLARMTVPREAGVGNTRIALSYVAWAEGFVAPAEFEVPIATDASDHSELSFVMFQDPDEAISLDSVSRAFAGIGVSAQRVAADDRESLIILADNRPAFSVQLARGDDVRETARVLGEGTPLAALLSRCDSRFEIGIVDFEQALDEQTNLNLIQEALQEATQGVIYNTWDKQLAGIE